MRNKALSRNVKSSWFSVERVFLFGSIIAYLLPIVLSLALNISFIQTMIYFFGEQMLLFVGLMLYGAIVGLFPKNKTYEYSRRSRQQPLV